MNLSTEFEKIKEQEWFQQLKGSYDQLSPEQQNYAKWGSAAAGALLFFYLTLSTIQSANSAKEEYFEKQELVQLLNQASDEIRRLKGQNAGFTQTAAQNWKTILQNAASAQGMPGDSVSIVKEAPGATQNIIQETLLEVDVKGIGVRPLTQFLVQLEHGNPPMKLKGMRVESSPEGTLTAHLNMSGYLAKPEKGEKTR